MRVVPGGMATGFLLMAFVAGIGWAEDTSMGLLNMSLEELMNIEVTSVSKKEELLFETAAAAYVLTGKDIRRSGVTTIPDALRLVPGAQVAQISANKWAVSLRGFNGQFASKLLVLIDGRSVYTPLFAGVYWDVQDISLADVDRIEVIRGPGAALWGANAVNGIINIITRDARESQGGLVKGMGGNEERGTVMMRYGGVLGSDAFYRIYAKQFRRDDAVDVAGIGAADAWQMRRAGFRLDWDMSDVDALTVQGDIYSGEVGQSYVYVPFSLEAPFTPVLDTETDISGGNILSRWQRVFSDGADMACQVYYDRTERGDEVQGVETWNTFDMDMQHRFKAGKRQEIVWGLGYRLMSDTFVNTSVVTLVPDSRNSSLFSGFVQGDIELIGDQLHLILGSKLEWNTYTSYEIQPSTRLLWTPGQRHTVWAAASRAVRTPGRFEHDGRLNVGIPPDSLFIGSLKGVYSLLGNSALESEDLLAFEWGYRTYALGETLLDIALFYNIYDNLNTLEAGGISREESGPVPYLVVPITMDNKMHGKVYGIELMADRQVLESGRVRAMYSFLKVDLNLDAGSNDISLAEGFDRFNPRHQFSLWSSFDLSPCVELDLIGRYVDELPGLDIDSYIGLDARLGWMPFERLELSIAARNLFDERHLEYIPDFEDTFPTQIQRSVYGMATWKF